MGPCTSSWIDFSVVFAPMAPGSSVKEEEVGRGNVHPRPRSLSPLVKPLYRWPSPPIVSSSIALAPPASEAHVPTCVRSVEPWEPLSKTHHSLVCLEIEPHPRSLLSLLLSFMAPQISSPWAETRRNGLLAFSPRSPQVRQVVRKPISPSASR
jgi:hypothetical protein